MTSIQRNSIQLLQDIRILKQTFDRAERGENIECKNAILKLRDLVREYNQVRPHRQAYLSHERDLRNLTARANSLSTKNSSSGWGKRVVHVSMSTLIISSIALIAHKMGLSSSSRYTSSNPSPQGFLSRDPELPRSTTMDTNLIKNLGGKFLSGAQSFLDSFKLFNPDDIHSQQALLLPPQKMIGSRKFIGPTNRCAADVCITTNGTKPHISFGLRKSAFNASIHAADDNHSHEELPLPQQNRNFSDSTNTCNADVCITTNGTKPHISFGLRKSPSKASIHPTSDTIYIPSSKSQIESNHLPNEEPTSYSKTQLGMLGGTLGLLVDYSYFYWSYARTMDPNSEDLVKKSLEVENPGILYWIFAHIGYMREQYRRNISPITPLLVGLGSVATITASEIALPLLGTGLLLSTGSALFARTYSLRLM